MSFKYFHGCILEVSFDTVKHLNSRYLWVSKNLSVMERCPLLGGNFKKIVTFGLNVLSAIHGMSSIWDVRYWGGLTLIFLALFWMKLISIKKENRFKLSTMSVARFYFSWYQMFDFVFVYFYLILQHHKTLFCDG